MWNFKGTLWNSTQNILPIHWKIWLLYNIEILRALTLRLKSSSTLWNAPQSPTTTALTGVSVAWVWRSLGLWEGTCWFACPDLTIWFSVYPIAMGNPILGERQYLDSWSPFLPFQSVESYALVRWNIRLYLINSLAPGDVAINLELAVKLHSKWNCFPLNATETH